MKINIIKTLSVFYLFIFIVSCERPVCNNENPIFDTYSPNEKEYKDELAKQLAKVDKAQLTYWLDTYKEDGSTKYISAHVQGEKLCAQIVLTINGSEKGIEGILRNKGKGYTGAELKNLKFNLNQDSEGTEFVFQEISSIVD